MSRAWSFNWDCHAPIVRMRAIAVGTASLLVLAACGGDGEGDGDGAASDGEPVEIRLASPFPETNAIGRHLAWWLEEIGGELDGMVEFDYHPGGALLSLTDSLQGVVDGRVDASYIVESFSIGQLPFWGATALPFQTDNVEAALRAQADLYENDERFSGMFRDYGLEVLFFAPINATIWALDFPIQSLSEMDGIRLRSAGRVAEAEAALGADAVFMDVAEVYESLDRNVVDGSSTFPLDNAVTFGLHEVRSYFVNPGIGIFTSAAVVMDLDTYESLPDEARRIIEEARSGEAVTMASEIQGLSETEGCDAFLDSGGTVVEIPADEVADWRASVFDDLVDTWKGQVNEAGYEPTEGREVDEDLDDWLATWQETVAGYEEDATYVAGLALCLGR